MEQVNSHKKLDYLIIGQGLVGTWLSYYALKAGKTCVVVNDSHTAGASQVASGVINPVTGRRIVQTWMIETFLPFALEDCLLGFSFTKSSLGISCVLLIICSFVQKSSNYLVL